MMDERLRQRFDADDEVRSIGRSAVLRRAAAEYVQRRRTCVDSIKLQFCNAKTNRLFPLLGRSSGVNCRKLAVVAAGPVPTAMYCRPSTA